MSMSKNKGNIEKLKEEFFELADLRKPMVKKWYYEGYYEDFSWNSHWEDCSGILKRENITLEEYNKIIQDAKKKAKKLDKKEKSSIYDYFTDSVATNAGRIGRAEWHYPDITDKRLINMLCILSSKIYQLIELNVENREELEYYVLEEYISILKDKYTNYERKEKIKKLLKEIFIEKNSKCRN